MSWTSHTSPTTSWNGRPVSGESLLYDNGELYDNDFLYDGTMMAIPEYTTRSIPSTIYTSRVIPS